GYIERPDEEIEIALLKTKYELKHNLARVHLGKKDFDTAKRLLFELIDAEKPIDTSPYYIDLINVFLSEKNYEEAENHLNKFKTLETEVKYNLYFIEAEILSSKGKFTDALEILQNALDKKPNSEIWYRIGDIYFILQEFEDAKKAFENAIEMEQDKAKYHKALAETLYELKEYEESAEYAITSIELVKFFPAAHYILGKSLEKMGDLENAKKAYQTAVSLKRKSYHKAEQALENLEEKINTPIEFKDKVIHKYRENQIVIVSGLPRSG